MKETKRERANIKRQRGIKANTTQRQRQTAQKQRERRRDDNG